MKIMTTSFIRSGVEKHDRLQSMGLLRVGHD